jgi:lipoprotein-releasing system permease protein
MNITPFFLAQRILFSHVYRKSISTMTIICFAGIFIGSFSLALITAIMNGFEVAIHEKMQGIHAHIIMQSYRNDIDCNLLGSILKKEFPEIIGFSPSVSHHILIHTQDSEETPIVAMIKGINPDTEKLTSSLPKKIIKTLPNIKNFSSLFIDNHIVIGKQMAQNNQIMVGDIIDLLFIREGQITGKKITFDSYPANISGIFETGIDEFDNGVIYSSLSFLEKLYPNIMVEQINLALNPEADEKAIIQKLRNRTGLEVYSWKDLYPSLVASLKLEKYVSFFILALILLVASMNIISLLFMQITQKRSVIALLKAMGMTNTAIQKIFFTLAMMLSSIACIAGLLAALFASYILQKYPFINLPDTYYVTHLPVAMTWHILCAVFGVVIFFSMCAVLLPIQRISSINISRVLRFEG